VGTTLQSMAVRTSDYDAIKTRLVRWLSAKGFEPATGPALFELDDDSDDERGLCLLANDSWVVVLYSHVFKEGERLRFELTRPDWSVLQIWTFDSDVWGYTVFDDGAPITVFSSDPRYLGSMLDMELPPGVTDDPELLCRALRLGPIEETIAGLQRRRRLFKEEVCRQFCQAIGVAPAGFDYRDLEGLPAPLSTMAGRWQVDHFRFIERGGSASESAQPLHAMVRKPLEQDLAAIRAASEMQAYLWPMRVFAWSMSLLMLPLIVVVTLWFRLAILFRPLPDVQGPYDHSPEEWEDSPFAALHALARSATRLEGTTLINETHRCLITLPAGVDAVIGPSYRGWVFQFKVTGLDASCHALRPRSMYQHLREMPYIQIFDEENFFAGAFQARAWTAVMTHGNQVIDRYSLFVQTPQAIYHFTLTDREPLTENTKRLMRSIGESFRLF
jgi:hypothetical protein